MKSLLNSLKTFESLLVDKKYFILIESSDKQSGQLLPFDYGREIRLQLTPFSHKLDITFNLRNDDLELKFN
jgi:hypothetical protein